MYFSSPTRPTVNGSALPWLNIMEYQKELQESQGEGQVVTHSPQGVLQIKQLVIYLILLGVKLKAKIRKPG